MTEETVKIKKSELKRVLSEIGHAYTVVSIQFYNSFIKFRLKCLQCEEYHDKKLYFEDEKYKGFPCKVCGIYDNVNAYSVKYPDGSYPKCNPSFCDNCIPIVKQRHHDLLYTRIEKNNTISNEDLSSGDL